MHLLKSVFRFTLFPGWLLLIGLSGWWFYRAGASPSLVIALTGAVSWLLVTIFERVLPYRADWNVHRGHLPTDVTSFGVIAGVIDPALNIIGPALAVWLVTVASPYGLPIFPTSMPALLQVVLVFLVAEFGKYWIHRWHHESEFLWRFHAMHHSSEHLYSLNNFRLHPFNHVLSYSMSMFPLALIGAPVEPLLVYSCVV
ncbi:MAG TPA: sterol desaturase family protein, partial [Noviherbaspirillum sp.]